MFISFEGCEGAGKTTLANYLFHKISQNFSVILTKEPGGNENNSNKFNILIKEMLLTFQDKIDNYTEALLFAADRIEHLKKIIIPALKKKKIVICDRYIDSSLAYQGYARQLGEKFIHNINFFAFKYLPDITFYLDLEPKIGLKRLKKERKSKIEYFDLKNINFHKKVRYGYLKLCQKYSKRIHKVDANRSLPEIEKIIESKINSFLKK
ncbi:thymidylate kinase [Candidatus Phytoplasma oryzae]|uniref:Thymidylate kinase n=1 Tax=Candidatus Phytoplasma oryzae TaxID=203274 RepID=A0A139JQC7_9MOLU|nr:dTMP kinase [Candidatus Phytoplasma oryzae]KXT29138.1 thymidylate kinase [Candidatus Phytoplasma oryzae]RAM57756.1 thymidylate kinase [Candidatus Phytoplasma oryzae]